MFCFILLTLRHRQKVVIGTHLHEYLENPWDGNCVIFSAFCIIFTRICWAQRHRAAPRGCREFGTQWFIDLVWKDWKNVRAKCNIPFMTVMICENICTSPQITLSKRWDPHKDGRAKFNEASHCSGLSQQQWSGYVIQERAKPFSKLCCDSNIQIHPGRMCNLAVWKVAWTVGIAIAAKTRPLMLSYVF